MSGSDTPHVTQLYPPPESVVRGAHVSGRAAYDQLVAEAEADYEGLLGAPGARVRQLEDALHAGRSTSARRRSSSGSRTAR